ncbi:teichoic acid biosynthesis protein C [Streptomyces caniferus]|uniref:phage baseplate protein n=1 Tax=Streptomyces caniferus TaxID=285557 RepID=UPI002E2881A2|nr:teichoic acid biosynthesis protein C [Streptomyces caniferus]
MAKPRLERPGRRDVLGLAARTALAMAVPAWRAYAPAGSSAGNSTGLAAPGQGRLLDRPLHQTTVLQSFAFDERRGHIYALQVMQGGIRLPGEVRAYSHAERARRGDLCLNRLSPDGVLTGYMFLKGFGHGGALGVDAVNGGSELWTEWDANPASGYGRGVCRFRFSDGRTLHRHSRELATYRPVPGSTSNCAVLDTTKRRLLLRYKVGGSPRFAVYEADRFAARDFRPITDFAQPDADLGLPFQGMALDGDSVYQLLGSGYGPDNPPSSAGNTRLSRIDWRTGTVTRAIVDRTAPGLSWREPEGLAVRRGTGTWLYVGFAHGPRGRRRFSLYAKRLG